MSLTSLSGSSTSTDSSLASRVATSLEAKAGRVASGSEVAAVENRLEASTVVILSEAALGALATIGKDAIGAVETLGKDAAAVVAWPFGVAKDAIVGVAHAVEDVAGGAWNLVSKGVKAAASEVGSLAHEVVVDIPSAVVSEVASDVGSVATAALNGASTVASGAVQLAALSGQGGLKMIDALI
jgi:hypothetical protein